MSCEPQYFSGISAEVWASMKEKAAAHGLLIGGDWGRAVHTGCTFDYEYKKDSLTLEITCVSKPLLMPCSVLRSRIDALMAEAIEKHTST